MAFEPSGNWLVTSNSDDATFWSLSERQPYVLTGHEGPVMSLAFAPDGRSVVSVSRDNTVRLWPLTADGGKEERILVRERMYFPQVAVASISETAVVGAGYGRLLVVPLAGGQVREVRLGPEQAKKLFIALGDGGRLVAATVGDDPAVHMLNLETGSSRVVPPDARIEPGLVAFLQFLGSDRILTSLWKKGLYLIDLKDESGRLVDSQRRVELVVAPKAGVVLGFTNDEEGALAGRPSELIRSRIDGSQFQTFASHGNLVSTVAIDAAETMVATGSVDGTVRIGPITGEEPHVFFGHEGVVYTLAFSPDGHWLASGGQDKTIRLWPVPDVMERPLHTRPHGELLGELRSLTNVRVVRDPSSPTGWKLARDPIPGWAKHPDD
jgi:WD40 repeat protein